MQRVVLGLNGGVDSSVTANLLQKQGYNTIGMFMIRWHGDFINIRNEYSLINNSNYALIGAEKLGISFQTIDLCKQNRALVMVDMLSEYEQGLTPNPNVPCNREFKFYIFSDSALTLGAEFIF
jgi:tRNA-specific 2-thiouridylase